MMSVCFPFFLSDWTSFVRLWACDGVLCRENLVGRAATLAEVSHRLQDPPSSLRVPSAVDQVYSRGINQLPVTAGSNVCTSTTTILFASRIIKFYCTSRAV